MLRWKHQGSIFMSDTVLSFFFLSGLIFSALYDAVFCCTLITLSKIGHFFLMLIGECKVSRGQGKLIRCKLSAALFKLNFELDQPSDGSSDSGKHCRFVVARLVTSISFIDEAVSGSRMSKKTLPGQWAKRYKAWCTREKEKRASYTNRISNDETTLCETVRLELCVLLLPLALSFSPLREREREGERAKKKWKTGWKCDR